MTRWDNEFMNNTIRRVVMATASAFLPTGAAPAGPVPEMTTSDSKSGNGPGSTQ